MTRQEHLDRVNEIFRLYIGPGTRGNSAVNINSLLGQVNEASDAQLKSFLSLHEFTMNLGSGVTPHATGHKGLMFDYWSDSLRSSGARFCALWMVTNGRHADQVHIYLHKLGLEEAISLSGIPGQLWDFTNDAGGVPHVWVMPTEDNVHRIEPLLRVSHGYSIS
jgi:hypothetical protein